jgi:hypothetical protein
MLRVRRAYVVALCLWMVVGTVRISPFYLAYFNEFVGGPTNGYQYLIDSNVDWGQDFNEIVRYLQQHQIRHAKLTYFGPLGAVASLARYGITAEPLWTPCQPTTGTIVISVNFLQGMYAGGAPCNIPYSWLRPFKPAARIGYSVFIYRIPLAPSLSIPLPTKCIARGTDCRDSR